VTTIALGFARFEHGVFALLYRDSAAEREPWGRGALAQVREK